MSSPYIITADQEKEPARAKKENKKRNGRKKLNEKNKPRALQADFELSLRVIRQGDEEGLVVPSRSLGRIPRAPSRRVKECADTNPVVSTYRQALSRRRLL